jgi:arylsulfatase
MHKPGSPFSQDEWQLFNLADDPTETDDLARKKPTKLKEMQQLWESEAAKFGASPPASRLSDEDPRLPMHFHQVSMTTNRFRLIASDRPRT